MPMIPIRNEDQAGFTNPDTETCFDTFVFDLDGTLLDTLPDLVTLTNTTLRSSGYPERTTEEIRSFVGNGGRALLRQAVPTSTSEQDVDRAMQQWLALFPTVGNELAKPYPGIAQTLHEMKMRGVRLGVLSNKYDEGVHQVIGTHLPDLFAIMHGESDEIPRKPDPAGLLRTIRELESMPTRTVYVGDSTGDITVARNAGVFSVAVTWGYHDVDRLKSAGPDVLIDDPAMLLDIADCPNGTSVQNAAG